MLGVLADVARILVNTLVPEVDDDGLHRGAAGHLNRLMLIDGGMNHISWCMDTVARPIFDVQTE